MDRPDAILIAGPTASGKSALAVRLAKQRGGIVINADSMQVYRDLRILSARPSKADMGDVPHVLFGGVDGATAYSVSRWLADATAELDAAADRNLLPIVVGGTGLYFKALTQGLSDIPPIPDAIRAEVRDWAAGLPPGELHAALAAKDPTTAARLRPSDPQRISRALEVYRATGRSLSSFQRHRAPPRLDRARCLSVYLTPNRDQLRETLDARFNAMMDDGALDEVAALEQRKLDPALPVMRALGVPPLLRLLRGEIDRPAAIHTAKADTRRYVKRQDTFARHQLAGFDPVVPDEADAFLALMSPRSADYS